MLTVLEGDVLANSAEAVVVPIDGTFSPRRGQFDRVLGNIGWQIVRRLPDLEFVDELEAQIEFPVPLGMAAAVRFSETPFRIVIVVSILYHVDHLDQDAKRALVRQSFARVLAVAQKEQVLSLATPVLQGGWRLSTEEAFLEMVHAHSWNRPSKTEVRVCCLDPAVAQSLRLIAKSAEAR